MSTILFIDPGSITTGYAWREGSRIISGIIAPNRRLKISNRLYLIRSGLADILSDDKSPLFSQLVIEIPVAHDYARNVGRKGSQTITASILILSRAVGVIQECCVAHDMDVAEVKATEWTKGFPKAYRCSGASQIADKRITDENEADAICLLDWWERTMR